MTNQPTATPRTLRSYFGPANGTWYNDLAAAAGEFQRLMTATDDTASAGLAAQKWLRENSRPDWTPAQIELACVAITAGFIAGQNTPREVAP